jgi:hypothetical protein
LPSDDMADYDPDRTVAVGLIRPVVVRASR